MELGVYPLVRCNFKWVVVIVLKSHWSHLRCSDWAGCGDITATGRQFQLLQSSQKKVQAGQINTVFWLHFFRLLALVPSWQCVQACLELTFLRILTHASRQNAFAVAFYLDLILFPRAGKLFNFYSDLGLLLKGQAYLI